MKKTKSALSIALSAVLAFGTLGATAPAAFAAAPRVQSDTTMDFTVDRGNTYAFKFTVIGSKANPQIAAGNGAVLQTENTVKKVENGNDTYYFKVRTIGNCGQESAVYTTLPGQDAVRHCKIKVGVKHNKETITKDGGVIGYYDGTVIKNTQWGKAWSNDYALAANRKKQYIIDCMSYLGYTHNAGLDSANIWTTPTAKDYCISDNENYESSQSDTGIEKGLEATVKDLVEELKKHKTTEYGVYTQPEIYEKQEEKIVPTFHSNLTYEANPEPVFISKYFNGFDELHATSEGGNMGCNEYVRGRAKEITGITVDDAVINLVPAYAGKHSEEYDAAKKLGYQFSTEPKKDSIAIEPGASALGHFEYVEAVDGDNIILSGGNGKYKPDDGLYYGRITRTKKELADWNTVYVYLK